MNTEEETCKKRVEQVRSRQDRITQHLIRLVIEEATDEERGSPTTYGVIAYLEDAIKYLERSAMRSNPANYLDEED